MRYGRLYSVSSHGVEPSRAEQEAAYGCGVPDVVGPGMDVLFCGINPGLYSGATGLHFARPGNRFWPVLHRSGFTPRRLYPVEQQLLPGMGVGITNLVNRSTAKAAELTDVELRAGAARLGRLVRQWRPGWVAVVGISAYRVAFGRPKVGVGPQAQTLEGAGLWVLPNPSGLNAHYSVDALAAEFRRFREVARGNGASVL